MLTRPHMPASRSRKVIVFTGVGVRALLLSLFAAFTLSVASPPPGAQHRDWRRELLAWRSQHAAELTKPDGWLSLVGLEWLQPGDNPFGSAADNKIHLPAHNPDHLGILRLEGEIVTLLPPSSGFPKDLLLDGQPPKQGTLRAIGNQDKFAQHFTIGTLNFYVIRRENRFALRIKDSHSAAIIGFHALQWFPPNPRFRVTAKWIPYVPAKTITLATLVGTSYQQPVPGLAEFSLDGKTYRIEPVLEDPAQPKLFFILRDTTSKTTTYGACRFLYTGFPTNGLEQPGQLVLDFNRLENPPCAYTPFSTCPLPPPANRLPIPLPVGEKRYHD